MALVITCCNLRITAIALSYKNKTTLAEASRGLSEAWCHRVKWESMSMYLFVCHFLCSVFQPREFLQDFTERSAYIPHHHQRLTRFTSQHNHNKDQRSLAKSIERFLRRGTRSGFYIGLIGLVSRPSLKILLRCSVPPSFMQWKSSAIHTVTRQEQSWLQSTSPVT